MLKQLQLLSVFLLVQFQPTPAPVPRCSPLYIINKLAEASNLLSDSNPYFPVPPCEYGGPLEALKYGDPKAVFVLAEPHKIPLHNFYEFIWLLKTGLPRIGRMIVGKEEFVGDKNILFEKYQHSTPYVRTRAIGVGRKREPHIIDYKDAYKHRVGGNIRSLFKYGPDKYTKFEGPYAYKNHHGHGYGHGPSHGHGHAKQGHEQPHHPQPKRQATVNIHNHQYDSPNAKTVHPEGGFQPSNGYPTNRRSGQAKSKSVFEKLFKL